MRPFIRQLASPNCISQHCLSLFRHLSGQRQGGARPASHCQPSTELFKKEDFMRQSNTDCLSSDSSTANDYMPSAFLPIGATTVIVFIAVTVS